MGRCLSPVIDRSEEEQNDVSGGQDEFSRVMGQRSWFWRFLKVKPANRTIRFNISAFQCRREILKLYKDWLTHGLEIVEDDRKGLILRARVTSPNSVYSSVFLYSPRAYSNCALHTPRSQHQGGNFRR